jgi:hypothetical protein
VAGSTAADHPVYVPTMRKKISTTIYVTPEQADKLKLLHERTKVPVAVYIREGIDLVLRHYAHLLPGQLALVEEPVSESPRPPDVGPSSNGSPLLTPRTLSEPPASFAPGRGAGADAPAHTTHQVAAAAAKK